MKSPSNLISFELVSKIKYDLNFILKHAQKKGSIISKMERHNYQESQYVDEAFMHNLAIS